MSYYKIMKVKTTKTLNVNIISVTPFFTEINIPHIVKQINIKHMVYGDNTSSFPRQNYCLHSSLINNECLTFVNVNSAVQLPNTTRFIYTNPVTIQGQYSFFMKDFRGTPVIPPAVSCFFIVLEFLNFVE